MRPARPVDFHGLAVGIEQVYFTRLAPGNLPDNGYRTFSFFFHFIDSFGAAGKKQLVVLPAPQRHFQRFFSEVGFNRVINRHLVDIHLSADLARFADMAQVGEQPIAGIDGGSYAVLDQQPSFRDARHGTQESVS